MEKTQVFKFFIDGFKSQDEVDKFWDTIIEYADNHELEIVGTSGPEAEDDETSSD